jgi:catechol 2,3-dioxygenase-like lactoylglutathione lyase family enzyme
VSVNGIAIFCRDVPRSAAFYGQYLGATVVGESEDVTTLGLNGPGQIQLIQLPAGDWSTAETDDGRDGFWHIGVRVDNFEALSEALRASDTRFFIEPVYNPVAKVWCAFFYDPDGTVIELVSGEQQYSQLFDKAAARRRAEMSLDGGPLFEHVAFTTPDWSATRIKWEAAGYSLIGCLDLSAGDPRGMCIYYVIAQSGLIVEVFTYTSPTNQPLGSEVRAGFAGLLATPSTQEALGLSLVDKLADGRARWLDGSGLAVIDAP